MTYNVFGGSTLNLAQSIRNQHARRFSVAAPRLWNSLPLNCRTAPSVNIFKIRLKTFLFDSA